MMMPTATRSGFWSKATGAFRAWEWWEHKITRHLGVAFGVAYLDHVPLLVLAPALLILLFAIFASAAYISLINEVTDLDADARAGKPNSVAGRTVSFRLALVGVTLLLGAAAGALLSPHPWALTFFALDWFVFVLYSVPPIRLKTRGLWGAVADALGEQVFPSLMMGAFVAEADHQALPGPWMAPVALWQFAAGMRGILSHQVDDYENDLAGGVVTLATQRGPLAVSRFVMWIVYPVEVAALAWVLFVFGAPLLVWPILALALLIEMRRGNFARGLANLRTPARDQWLPLIEYYKVYFPVTYILALSWQQPVMIVLLLVQFILFPGCTRQAAYAVMGLCLAPVRGGFYAWHTGAPRVRS